MEASKHMEQALATAGEMITVWYPGRKANECVPFRAKVKKASHKHGMHIDLIDLSENDPHKEDWLDSESSNWLIGDWHSYSSKDEASQERSNQKADAATVRLRQGIVRSKGATAVRPTTRPTRPRTTRKTHPHAQIEATASPHPSCLATNPLPPLCVCS